MSARGLVVRGRCGGSTEGHTGRDCPLSSSDTQYKMTISMADWPSESSEVRWWSGHPWAGDRSGQRSEGGFGLWRGSCLPLALYWACSSE